MRIVVTGLIATYPLGGVSWDFLAYVKGLRQLGADVLYLEDTGQWVYDPQRGTYTGDVGANVRYLQAVLQTGGAPTDKQWFFRAADGAGYGLAEREVLQFCQRADVFLNLAGSCWLRDEYRGARRTVYVDSDPGYTQAVLESAERGAASAEQKYSARLVRAHDVFFTFAESIGDATCAIPLCGLRWRTTRQPIVLEDWRRSSAPERGAFTTVMSWKTDVTLPTIGGVTYGGKDVELLRFLELPRRTTVTLEAAIAGEAPRDRLRRCGWRVADAQQQAPTMEAYRDYLRGSRGEWSVAKEAYVATRSGWFSGRTGCYLALGRPAVVQDTGLSDHYPTGAGLLVFRNLEEAVAALAEVESDYARHAAAARAVAEAELDAEKVLTRLLDDIHS